MDMYRGTGHRILWPVVLLLAAAHPQVSTAQSLQGNVDTVDSNACRIVGWARDPQVTDPIQVAVYADGDSTSGTLVSTITANLPRTDLPYTDQNHGFNQILPLIDGQPHTINVYGVLASGTALPLNNGTRRTLQCFQHPASIFVSAPSSQVILNDTAQLTAAVYDSLGNPIPNQQLTWSVSDKTAFSVDAHGVVTAVGLGWADIYADAPGARGTLRLQVVPLSINVHPANQTVLVGTTVQYSADVLDVNSQPVPGITLSWRAYAANAGGSQDVGIDQTGLAFTFGFGTYFIEAYYNYTVGAGPFIPRFFGNTLLTVNEPTMYSQAKLLDSSAVRQSFQLREHRGLLSVNDSGQIAYVGWLEGYATAALMWGSNGLVPLAVASTPTDFPGSNLIDINNPAINNNGEISAQCVLLPPKGCLLFGNRNGTSSLILFDGVSGGGVANIRNYGTTRFGLNDNSITLFRADYFEIGGQTTKTGLFTTTSNGLPTLQVPAATALPAFASTYTFDTDFGIDNSGNIIFYATSGTSRALFRMTPDAAITRIIGTGDMVNGTNVTSLGNAAMGKNGQFATMVNTSGTNPSGVVNPAYLLLWSSDASKVSRVQVGYATTIYSVSGAGEAVYYGSNTNGVTGLYRTDGTTLRAAFTNGAPSPIGDSYAQFDSAGITAKGEVIAQARTTNNLLVVVNSGAGAAAKPTVLFQTGAMVNAPAGPAFYSFVLNSHTGDPMIKTGWYSYDVFELASGALVPRLVNGDRMTDGWFYEGNQDVRRNSDGDIFVSTDQSITQIGAGGSTLLGHFPQRISAGNLNTGFQVVANTSGTVVITGGTNFGPQHISILSNSVATPIAWLNGSGQYRTASPGGGYFLSSSDIGVDDNGTIYAYLHVSGGPDGLFYYTAAGGWKSAVMIGDAYDSRNISSIDSIHVAGTACYAHLTTTGNVTHISSFQNGVWNDLLNIGDTIPVGGVVTFLYSQFDVNRKGGVAALVQGTGGIQYVVYLNSSNSYVVADNDNPRSTGELLVNYFNVSLNDDGRIFATAMNDVDQVVLYEFDPQ